MSALRWLACQEGLSPVEAKLLKWRVRHQLLRFAVADLRLADGVDQIVFMEVELKCHVNNMYISM